ncbi:MAG: YceD family protein [Bacilli bacterium]
MKWSIFQLKKHAHSLFPFQENLELSGILERNADIRKVEKCHVSGTIDTTATKITVDIHIVAELILVSSRTLEDVPFHVNIKTQETFLLDSTLQVEDEVEVLEGETLHLTPLVEELILLEIPMQIYASDTEEALQSGNGWEVIQEVEVEEKLDPRFQKLANLFKEEK